MTNTLLCICTSLFLISCQTRDGGQNSQNAKKLFSEGMKILDNRISIQYADKEKAIELNKRAIEKFSAAYKADTSYVNAALFASECAMYARDYQTCLYWTSILMRLDTSQHNQRFCTGRIEDCNNQLRSRQ
jgi:hypothetical protein